MSKIIFIFPGNPPASYFYHRWVSLLELNVQSKFIILNYNTFDYKKSDFINSLVSQVKHSLKMREVIEFDFIGHSIGCYFSLLVERELTNKPIQNIAIFPFLGKPKFKGRIKLLIFSLLDKTLLKKYFIKLKNLISLIDPDINYITDQELDTALRIAKWEKEYLKKNRSNITLNFDHIKLITNEADIWCTKETVQNIIQNNSVLNTNLDHDFVVNEKQIHQMNQYLKDIC